jgi:hypothetical protein
LAWSLAGWGGATEPDEACFFSSFLALALRFFSRRFARTASASPSRPSLVAALAAGVDSSVVSAVEHGGLVKTRIGICWACWKSMIPHAGGTKKQPGPAHTDVWPEGKQLHSSTLS